MPYLQGILCVTTTLALSNRKMATTLKVSIVMTVFNHAHLVQDAIHSVLDQTYKDYELIIINDGSTDNTRDVIQNFQSRQIKIENIEHIGRSKALNIGLKMARGEYVTFIDSDDTYLPEKIRKQVEFLDRNANIVLVGTNAEEWDLHSGLRYLNKPPRTDRHIRNLLLYGAIFPFPTIMTRACALRSVGFCSEELKLKVDFDFIGKIASKGKLATISEPLVIIRRHPKTYFKSVPPDIHRKTMLKVRWRNLWRLKPHFGLFIRLLLWHSFEYVVHLFPERARHLLPEQLRQFSKNSKLINPSTYFRTLKKISE